MITAAKRQVEVARLIKVSRAVAVGTTPTLPNNFTGWSLDAQNGLSLYLNGQLQARYGSQGGAGVLQSFSGYQPCDSSHNCRLRFELPPNAVNAVNACHLSFSLQPFRASQQTASGASSSSTTGGSGHQHDIFVKANSGLNTALYVDLTSQSHIGKNVGQDDDTGLTDLDSPAHSHGMAHTHPLNAPTGLYDTGCAQGCHVFIDGVDRTTALGGPWGGGSSIDVSDLDISAYITTTGWHEVAITSTTLGVIVAQVTTKALLKTV